MPPGPEQHLAMLLAEATLVKIPLGRIGESKEVAGVAVFLASPAASLIMGETILVDDGRCAH
jgi:3-oxoacyl-[acyl-carrier protein] reductase